jgi:Transposase DDE domain
MSAVAKPKRLRPVAHSFLDSLREFLTPALWKQAHHARRCKKSSPRWDTQPLVMVLLTMTWCCGDSQPERFETAKAFCSVCLHKRRRPGQTTPGFHKALARLPLCVLRTVAAGVRRRLAALLDLHSDGFVALGCDGSRLECPRSRELEKRMGKISKKRAASTAPMLWVTALVHLRTGLLWAWRLGKGTASERQHLLALLPTLPAAALIVADAGFNGYALAQAILQANASFLIRMGGKVSLYVDEPVCPEQFTQGLVYSWPEEARRQKRLPLQLRLIRIRGKKRRDVWLLTNILDSKRLSAEQAARYYHWRWENEGLFRTYKRTLSKVKLLSRTVRLVHREAEGSLLATQLLLAQGVRGMAPAQNPAATTEPQRCSPRKVLMLIRKEIQGQGGKRQRKRFGKKLAEARREQRQRQTPKVQRRWPRRADHKPLKPPKILVLPNELKALLAKLKSTAA